MFQIITVWSYVWQQCYTWCGKYFHHRIPANSTEKGAFMDKMTVTRAFLVIIIFSGIFRQDAKE